MHEVLRAKAQGLVVSGHQETVRIFVEAMKKDGFWDEELEALPIPAPS